MPDVPSYRWWRFVHPLLAGPTYATRYMCWPMYHSRGRHTCASLKFELPPHSKYLSPVSTSRTMGSSCYLRLWCFPFDDDLHAPCENCALLCLDLFGKSTCLYLLGFWFQAEIASGGRMRRRFRPPPPLAALPPTKCSSECEPCSVSSLEPAESALEEASSHGSSRVAYSDLRRFWLEVRARRRQVRLHQQKAIAATTSSRGTTMYNSGTDEPVPGTPMPLAGAGYITGPVCNGAVAVPFVPGAGKCGAVSGFGMSDSTVHLKSTWYQQRSCSSQVQ